MKILSALSMAAVSVIGAKAAHGQATLNLYYGQDPSIANSNNGIIVGSGFKATGNGKDSVGSVKFLSGATEQTVSQTAVTTITVPVGDYLSLAIDALLTGNSNADGGINESFAAGPQPSFLGLSELSLGVLSSDASASVLTPISTDTAPLSSYNSQNTYHSTTTLNTSVRGSFAGAKFVSQGPNSAAGSGYNVLPNWGSVASADPRADVSPNETGFDPGHGNGQVGLNGFTSGGNTSVDASTAAGVGIVEQFASSTNTAGYNNATDYYDSLIYQGLTAGVVTLTPNIKLSGSSYWTLATHGTAATGTSTANSTPGTTTTYTPHTLTGNDTINQAPMLVIDVVGGASSVTSHKIVSLEATADSNYGTTITNGTGVAQGTFSTGTNTLTVTGGSGHYTVAQVTGISSAAGVATGNVAVAGFNPITDEEIYGLDVKVNGTQATAGQLATLIAAIGGTGVPASTGVTASTTEPDAAGVISALDTASTTYNLFLTFAGGGVANPENLNLDLAAANDPGLVGYTFSAVAVVPEPVSLGLLAIGGLGLMSRRSRRKA